MGLKYTRRILSVILTVLVAASAFTGAVALVMSGTYGNSDFYVNHWCSDELMEQCEKQMDKRFAALSIKSGIPLDVFNAVKRDGNARETIEKAVESIFTGYDSSLYSESRVEYFYSLCTTYLDANQYQYSQEDIMAVSREAAQIFSDCLGIHNVDMMNDFISKRQKACNTCFAICLIICLLCVSLIAVLYKDKEKAFSFISSAIIASGTAQLFMALFSVIFKIQSKFDVHPAVYEAVFAHLKNIFMLWNAVSAVCLIALGVVILIISIRVISIKEFRSHARYYKVVGKL